MRQRPWVLPVLAGAAVLVVVAVAVLAAVGTDRKITVGTGPVNSAAYATAMRVADGLIERGFDVEVIPTEQTGNLIELLADPDSPIEVTFVTEDIDPSQYPGVNSLGTVYRLPYLFVAWPDAHGITSLAQARGKRIDLGPVGSVRAAFTEDILEAFGVTAANSTFLNIPTSATLEEVRALDVEIQATDNQDDRSFIDEALATEELRIIPVPEARALADRIPSAEPIDIPYAAFSLAPPLPREPVPSVAQLVTVVALDSLSAAAAYATAQELTAVYSAGTAFTSPGEFPNFADRQLPSNPYAADYYANGSVPWHFASLPPVIADSFFGLLLLGTIILVVASVWSIFLPEVYSLWTGVIRPRAEDRYLAAMEESLSQGRELSPQDRRRLARILSQHETRDLLQSRAERMRPHLDE